MLGTLVVIAGIVAACNAVTSSKPGTTGTTRGSSTSSTGSSTTTTTLPTAFGVGIHIFENWVEKGPDVTTETQSGSVTPGRVLTTEVRYPVLGGGPSGEVTDAVPARTGAPYPVIVFAHGFDLDPADYAPLLDAWVRAGFVVVSPVFPDENSATVTAAGGPETAAGQNLENDVYKEPGDISFVLKQLDEGTQGWATKLRAVMNFEDIGLAGQSDGANVVAALSFSPALHAIRKSLPSAPKAVAVLSGQEWGNGDTYGASATSPALLQVQSDADACNSPSAAANLFYALQDHLSTKWFEVLFGAAHLQPYEGVSPWAPVVESVTTKFFELELHWRTTSTSAADVVAAGTVTTAQGSVSEMTTTVGETTIPQVDLIGTCWTS